MYFKPTMNDCAPWKEIKVRSNHVFGLSDDTQEGMRQRDKMRENVKKSSPTEKKAMQLKYKKQRNMVRNLLQEVKELFYDKTAVNKSCPKLERVVCHENDK